MQNEGSQNDDVASPGRGTEAGGKPSDRDAHKADDHIWDEWFGGARTSCGECGEPHQPVRPGKTQPSCDCADLCRACGGRKEYHLEPLPEWPQVSGYFCGACGP